MNSSLLPPTLFFKNVSIFCMTLNNWFWPKTQGSMHLNTCSQFGAFWEALEPLRDGSNTRKLGNCGDILERMLGLYPSPHSSLLPRCRQVKSFQFHMFYQDTLTCCRSMGPELTIYVLKSLVPWVDVNISFLWVVYLKYIVIVINNILVHTYAHCFDNLAHLCRWIC